ncbi:MAG: hypothetical protein E6Q78_05240 [Rhodoferax sp.]|nr:MAG: hypothetical protein E6Q78_05240 [Rhodoferax sp.]
MAFSQTDLDNINTAIATGEMTVEFNGRRVTYRSMAELERARSIIESDIARASAASVARPRSVYQFRFTTARGD